MKKLEQVEVPIWMRKLPKDRRGYPIPHIVKVDNQGRPHFTINEESKRQEVIKKDQCSICGSKLLTRRASIGGPAAAFHPHGAFIDTPMHLECARYALQVCPYLAAPHYTKRIEDKTFNYEKNTSEIIAMDPTMDPKRPILFCMVIHTGQRKIMGNILGLQYVQYIKPKRPYFAIEYWREGEQLTNEDGEGLAKQALLQVYKDDFEQILKEWS